MAKLVVVLEQNTPNTYRCVLRAGVPAARQSFWAAKQSAMISAYQDIDGPTQVSDQALLRSGAATEKIIEFSILGRTLLQLEADLVAAQAVFQAEINAFNPWNRYGSSYDGATWNIITGS